MSLPKEIEASEHKAKELRFTLPMAAMEETSPEIVFDVCWEVYRGARETLERQTTKYCERPDWWERSDIRPKLKDWITAFALAGQEGLSDPELASRKVMFRLYYLGLTPYESAKDFLGLSEVTFTSWRDDIRNRVGQELIRRGMFPPRKFLGMGDHAAA
jgi:hypothetical protein